MDKAPSGSKPSHQKQEQVTGGSGDASPPTSPSTGTGPIGSPSATPLGAGGGDSSPPPPTAGSPEGGGEGGRSMELLSARGKQPTVTGTPSTTAAGSPPPPSESPEGGKADTKGLKKKRKKASFDALEMPQRCSVCGRSFSSWKALFGHMRSHKDRQWRGVFPPPISPPKQQVKEEQAEELTSTLLNIGHAIMAERSGTEGESSAVAEGSPSSSSTAEAQRKKIHMKLDLNKEAPTDSDEERGSDSEGT